MGRQANQVASRHQLVKAELCAAAVGLDLVRRLNRGLASIASSSLLSSLFFRQAPCAVAVRLGPCLVHLGPCHMRLARLSPCGAVRALAARLATRTAGGAPLTCTS